MPLETWEWHRCWWRMLETKCVGDKFKMLMTDLRCISHSKVSIILEINLMLNYFSIYFLEPFYLYWTLFEKSDDHMNEYEKLISLFFRKTLTLTAGNVSPLFCAGRIDYSMCDRGLYRRNRWWSGTFHKVIIIIMFLAVKCLFN